MRKKFLIVSVYNISIPFCGDLNDIFLILKQIFLGGYMKRIELNLSEDEQNIIIDILENTISDLSMEITNTDKLDYREKLKLKRNILQKLLKIFKET